MAVDCYAETVKELTNDKATHRNAFLAALDGIRKGEMDFKNDSVLPHLVKKLKAKTDPLKTLSREEEGKLLSLTG